jgi:hypothetical protein
LVLVAVVVIGVGIYVGGGWGVFITAVGGSLMPAALVNAWLDPLLREDAAHDMKALLDVREDLVATGFLAARRSPAFEVGTFVGRTNQLDVLPLNTRDWMNRDYAKILTLCTASAVNVRVFLSAPDEPWCTLLAHRENLEAGAIRDQLMRLPDQLLRAWDAAHPHVGSRIEIFFYDGVPSTGITLCDGGVAVELGPAIRDEEVKVPGHVLSFATDSDMDTWARRQLPSDSGQSPPTSAGLRPLPQPAQQPAKAAQTLPTAEKSSTDARGPAPVGTNEPERSETRDGDDAE